MLHVITSLQSSMMSYFANPSSSAKQTDEKVRAVQKATVKAGEIAKAAKKANEKPRESHGGGGGY